MDGYADFFVRGVYGPGLPPAPAGQGSQSTGVRTRHRQSEYGHRGPGRLAPWAAVAAALDAEARFRGWLATAEPLPRGATLPGGDVVRASQRPSERATLPGPNKEHASRAGFYVKGG